MSTSSFFVMATMIVMLWIVALCGAHILQRVVRERDHAKFRGDAWKDAAWGWQQRALHLERAAQDAWHAYHGIGMGPGGWNAKDRETFAQLARTLDHYNARGKIDP